jgi:hypothetical protein
MKAATKPVAFRRFLKQQFPGKSRLLILPPLYLHSANFIPGPMIGYISNKNSLLKNGDRTISTPLWGERRVKLLRKLHIPCLRRYRKGRAVLRTALSVPPDWIR